jgi:microcystin degradation protein MlrC
LCASNADGPAPLLDHGDNVMSGGTCDTTDELEECLRQGMTGIGVDRSAIGTRRGRDRGRHWCTHLVARR